MPSSDTKSSPAAPRQNRRVGQPRPERTRSSSPRRDEAAHRPDSAPQSDSAPQQGKSQIAGGSRSSRHEIGPLRFVPNAREAHAQSMGIPLFAPLDEAARSELERLPAVIDAVMPLSAPHRKGLPNAVRELSAMLTSERSGLHHPYWSAPRLVSAYLRYFLPWNLVRLVRLLPGLGLQKPEPEALVVDFGSGPLTLPLALWIALPEWRGIPLHILAVDASGQALDYGRALFSRLAPDSPWRIRTLRAPLHKAMREVRGKPTMVMFGNVLNELAERKGEARGDTAPMAEKMLDLAAAVTHMLDERGTLLCVEPGTRLGGTVLEHLRAGGLAHGMRPLSPCTHARECPLLVPGAGKGWCHAVVDTADAPAWLHNLAHVSGLGKDSLSLSHLVMTRDKTVEGQVPGMGRVLSDAFAVPGLGLARYTCSAQGLGIVANASAVPQGALVALRPEEPPRHDAKSGARVMRLEAAAGPQNTPHTAAHIAPGKPPYTPVAAGKGSGKAPVRPKKPGTGGRS